MDNPGPRRDALELSVAPPLMRGTFLSLRNPSVPNRGGPMAKLQEARQAEIQIPFANFHLDGELISGMVKLLSFIKTSVSRRYAAIRTFSNRSLEALKPTAVLPEMESEKLRMACDTIR